MSDEKDKLIQELLEALVVCVMRLDWLNDPRTGNTEKLYVKFARRAIKSAERQGHKAPDA